MRQFLPILFLSLIALPVFSQVPLTINYQGVARDASGNPIANQTIGLQFKISNPANTSFHSETQSVATNSLGLFSTKIGAVTPLPTTGWNSLPCILDVSIDVNSSGFVSLGSQTLASVPYALYALNDGGLPTATVNGTTLRYNAGTSQWQSDTLLLNNGSRVSVGKRSVVQNNKFKSIADNVSDSAAIFGLHTSATDGYAGVRGFASGSSLPSSTLNATGIAGGHFVGFNFLGQGIGALGQGISNSGNGIGVVGIGSSSGTAVGSNYAIGLYGSVDLNSTAINKYAGVFDNGGVIIRDSLILGPSTNFGVAGDVLTRSSTGRARWQTPGAVGSGPFTNSANYIHAASSFTTNRIVFGVPYPAGGFPFLSRVTVVNNSVNVGDTSLSVYQFNSSKPAFYSEAKGSGFAISAKSPSVFPNAYAGFFDGGIITKGKNSANSAFSLLVKDVANTDLFSVRNDGNVGIGTINPSVNSRLAIKDGHFQTQQTTGPTIIGNNNAIAAFWNGNSTDVAGIIEIQINASPLPGAQATVTFNQSYNSAPIVVITPMNNFYGAKAVALSDVFVTTSTSGFTINFNIAYPIPSSTMYFNYIVIEGN